MASLALNVAKGKGAEVINQVKGKLGSKPNVDWTDFNYPPLLRVFHYDLDELESDPDLKKLVRWLFLTHIAVLFLTVLNFVSNIIQTASISGQGLRILYSIFWFLLINPVQTFWFYLGYKGLVDEPDLLSQCGRFKIGGFVLVVLYFCVSIFGFCCFNGWMRVSDLFSNDYSGVGVLALSESILMYFLIAAILYIMWKVHFRGMGL